MNRFTRLPFRRIGAFMIDYVVIAIFIGALTAVRIALLGLPTDGVVTLSDKMTGHALQLLFLSLPVLLYFSVLESSGWQATVGKRVCGLSVTMADGGRVPFVRALLRNALRLLPWEMSHAAIWYVPGQPFVDDVPVFNMTVFIAAIFISLIYLAALFIGSGRTLYDRLAGVAVQRRGSIT